MIKAFLFLAGEGMSKIIFILSYSLIDTCLHLPCSR